MDDPVTKRLHISGLTPSVTADDLCKRFSVFGNVRSVDGIGAVNGVGLPRNFAHITIDTTAGKLAKCMNVLSGSTWKGAKLKLGEAKPEYKERLAVERAAFENRVDQQPPRKRRRVDGVHAQDMSLVTPETALKRGGWKVTSMGRILRPIRMRPVRPLPPTLEEQNKTVALSTKNLKKNSKSRFGKAEREEKGRKKRNKEPVSRARIRTIDVTKWGSTQLKGVFLESQGAVAPRHLDEEAIEDSDLDSNGEEGEEAQSQSDEPESRSDIAPTFREPLPPIPPPLPKVLSPFRPGFLPQPSDDENDLAVEKSRALSLLSSLFAADHHDDDWMGKESVGSDVDEEELLKHHQRLLQAGEEDVGFEVVPRNAAKRATNVSVVPHDREDEEEGGEQPERSVEEEERKNEVSMETPQTATTSLKDLFAPREEEGGFSLLGHLDLDLELDEELGFAIGEEVQELMRVPGIADGYTTLQPPSATITSTPSSSTVYINPKEPLFFPRSSAPDPRNGINYKKPHQKDALDMVKEKKWYWLDPEVAFYRTKSEDEIRLEWEAAKGELTKDWRRRAREAGKVSRRRFGGQKGIAGGASGLAEGEV